MPTVGPSASAAGVSFRTGHTTTTGERVASGLIWRFGSLDCVSDNAGCFADRPFPVGGSVISFGGHDVYVATVAPPRYPREVLRYASPPPGAGASNTLASPCVVQEVMATGDEYVTKTTRVRGPNLECNVDGDASGSGPKAPPPPSRLEEVRAKLSTPLTAGADPTTIEADLEAHRQLPLKQAEEVVGGALGAEIERDGAEPSAPSTELPVYNTPEKNMLAAQAAAEELWHLEGEELCCQTRRCFSCPSCSRQHPRRSPGHGGEVLSCAKPAQGLPGHARQPKPVEPAEERRKRPKTRASAGRLPRQAALASRPALGWARASSRLTPENASTGSWKTALRKRKAQPAPSASGHGSWVSPWSMASCSPATPPSSAHTWLNNLPAGSINSWLDFEDAFVSNFTGTYRRPGRPQKLEMCKQGPDETDRAYLKRWCKMCNSCEGVHEIQAINFFVAGYRPNTMLWHKLRHSDPKTMAALMAIADKYALAEEAGKAPADVSPAPAGRDHNKPAENKPAEGASHGSRQDNYRGKRHSDQPDRRYGSAHVAAVDHAAAGASQR
ncbi:hypothetical protein QYE76_047473 [Lolium multiflorum]|uniref:Retrotransposon gag domain-containing protein n=1 Tax=Lolium multiflorum TaxID=4521 RepID=A0AAD8WZN5_LOLMU|nr:hypothetical protein QYE76_047473 [Lolium multiflorum]